MHLDMWMCALTTSKHPTRAERVCLVTGFDMLASFAPPTVTLMSFQQHSTKSPIVYSWYYYDYHSQTLQTLKGSKFFNNHLEQLHGYEQTLTLLLFHTMCTCVCYIYIADDIEACNSCFSCYPLVSS